ncbi:MAG: M28 family peptidase [Bacteroidota bacterium]
MNDTLLFCAAFLLLTNLFAQNKLPEYQLTQAEVEAHLRFLASDELQGRRTGEAGIEIAARYIAAQWQALGVKTINDGSYLQAVPLREITPMPTATLVWNRNTFSQGDNLMMLAGQAAELNTKIVFANYGWIDEAKGINDYEKLNVRGKVVVTFTGTSEDNTPTATFTSIAKKQQLAKERGALALIEIFRMNPSVWQRAVNYFKRSRIEVASSSGDLAYGWILPGKTGIAKGLKSGKKCKIALITSATNLRNIPANNVVGLIEGSDPKLREEYILLSAHYDHVGTGANGGGAFTAQDSIFNGARDNAFGTTALLAAAKVFSKVSPKRSVILLACTAEEIGLLGSRYYADNPLIPLEKTVFNLNSDGAGYNDKTAVAIIGLDRVGAKEEIVAGTAAFDLKIIADPMPEQGLFDRSDNASFAAKGIPAPNFSPGIRDFDKEIMKFYHQVGDNPETVDYAYLLQFCKAYTHTARLIADKATRPFWMKGDKYEAAGKALYGVGVKDEE